MTEAGHEASVYRRNARPVESPGTRRNHVRGVLLALGIASLGFIGWLPLPERSRAELRLARQPLPSHDPLTAVCSDWSGERVFAVGKHGAVIARQTAGAAGKETREPWVRIPAVVDTDLRAVAYGDGPALLEDSTPRVFAVGGRGALLNCHSGECRAMSTTTLEDLHAVAIAGGQAIAVGDGGTILHVTVDASRWRATYHDPSEYEAVRRLPLIRSTFVSLREQAELLRKDSELLVAERVDVGVTSSLRAVTLTCDEYTRCRAKIVGEPDIVIEGEGSGPCDNGRAYLSLGYRHCSWTWTSRKASPDDARPEQPIALPVHVVTKRGVWRTETSKTNAVVSSTMARIGSMTMPLSSPVEVRAAVATPGGAFGVGADGELYAVQ